MKFKGLSEDRVWLLGHKHLEAFLDGDSVSRVFVIWGETNRMTKEVSCPLGSPSSVYRPGLLAVAIILQKRDQAEARCCNSVCSSF